MNKNEEGNAVSVGDCEKRGAGLFRLALETKC